MEGDVGSQCKCGPNGQNVKRALGGEKSMSMYEDKKECFAG